MHVENAAGASHVLLSFLEDNLSFASVLLENAVSASFVLLPVEKAWVAPSHLLPSIDLTGNLVRTAIS